ncbi:hypothetical protein L873DRAFT_1732690 [Choiromyces venosus 120613-1]|uniref:Peroxin/Ferlin domain-containing protein n=1 Tax=Choiromyces venosus 120613-1 TaxID=1336337 RepID=A0A3N4JZJ2_9PEZI|nr:hypothetical protein L873DRAFT_1732690 [Choiromyces venosus 120613-1]
MASLSSFRASRSFNSSSGELNHRINLQDNTVSQPPTAPASEAGDVPAQPSNTSATSSAAPGRRETLRKAIAQRKYRGWVIDPATSSTDDDLEIANGDGAPDPRAGGVVERTGEEDMEIVGPSGGGGEDGLPQERGRDRSNTGGNARRGSAEHVPARKKSQKQKKEIAEIDVLYENQRGISICGIPLFSSKGLLNLDPASWQNGLFHDSAVSIVNAQLPDPSWAWAWKTWYVDMTQDVDEEGWTYSFSFNPAFSWHGNHVWFHSFVRRRRWLRKRVKISHNPDFSSREGSQERPHGLNQDYFTIHSRHLVDGGSTGTGAGKKKPRRSVMEGSEWTGQNAEMDDDLEEEGLITDIPKLLRVLKIARLDREKIEVVEKFLKDSGEEVIYLPERIPDIMSLMIFQASRRQLLKLLIAASDELVPSQPSSTASTPHAEPSDPLLPTDGSSTPHPGPGLGSQSGTQHADQKAARQRKYESLKKAIEAAEQEVRRLEYWSDVKGVATETEGGMKVAEDQSGGLPLGIDDSELKWKGKEVEK